ncbi:MAG: hypothetical protein QM729_16335 [Solirubrobacterales bacterium]
MIRQARNYLVGAFSGVTLIGIAIGVFVLLVSAQVFHNFPLGQLSGQSDSQAVAPSKALKEGAGTTATTARGATATRSAKADAGTATTGRHHVAKKKDDTENAVVAAIGAEPTAAGEESSTSESTGTGGSHTSSSSSGSKGSSSSGSSDTATASQSSGGDESTSGSESGSSKTPTTTAKTISGGVEETVDTTVGAVNEATGGSLEKSGVSTTVEEVVKTTVGPESTVGKTVDGAAEVVSGLLGGKGSSGE